MGANQKIYSIILFGLLGISGLMFILFMLGAMGEAVLLNWCFFLFGIATLAAIVFPMLSMAKDFKRAKTSLIGVGVLVVIFIIGFAMSTAEQYVSGETVVDAAVVKLSEAGLITFYVMILLAIASILYTEISKAIK